MTQLQRVASGDDAEGGEEDLEDAEIEDMEEAAPDEEQVLEAAGPGKEQVLQVGFCKSYDVKFGPDVQHENICGHTLTPRELCIQRNLWAVTTADDHMEDVTLWVM